MRQISFSVVTQRSDARPTTGTVLAMPKLKKLAPIDAMKAIAWCHAVMSASKKTAQELAHESFGRPNDPPRIEFPTYAKGGRSPSQETLKIVQAQYPAADLTDIFDTGPDMAPLWRLLSDECPEAFCMSILDSWLLPLGINGKTHVDDAELLSLPFATKVTLAWLRLVGEDVKVDADRYDKGEISNVISLSATAFDWLSQERSDFLDKGGRIDAEFDSKIKKLIATEVISIHDICAVIAIRRIAEARREARFHARYMFDGVLHHVQKAFQELGIGEHLLRFLGKWRAPCSPATIALHDTMVRRIFPALKQVSSPRDVAIVAAAMEKLLASQESNTTQSNEPTLQ